MKNLKMKKEFKVIADLLTDNTRVLDVGCGYGWLLSALNNKWKKYGVEVSKYAGMYSKKFGNIHLGEIENFHERNFDLITALHVIEHINKPEIFLLKLKKILNLTKRMVADHTQYVLLKGRSYLEELKLVSNKNFSWKDFPSITSEDSRLIGLQAR